MSSNPKVPCPKSTPPESRISASRTPSNSTNVSISQGNHTDHVGRAPPKAQAIQRSKQLLKASIEPELVRLREESRRERRRQTKRITGGLATMAVGNAIGVFGGLPDAIGRALIGAAARLGAGSWGKTGLQCRVRRSLPYSAVLNMTTSTYLLTSKEERPQSNPARRGITLTL